VDLSKIEPLFNLRPEFLDAGHEEIVKQYGTMENFIREGLGISNEQLDHLCDELL
jgi:protein-tyrosine phosphatase